MFNLARLNKTQEESDFSDLQSHKSRLYTFIFFIWSYMDYLYGAKGSEGIDNSEGARPGFMMKKQQNRRTLAQHDDVALW